MLYEPSLHGKERDEARVTDIMFLSAIIYHIHSVCVLDNEEKSGEKYREESKVMRMQSIFPLA